MIFRKISRNKSILIFVNILISLSSWNFAIFRIPAQGQQAFEGLFNAKETI